MKYRVVVDTNVIISAILNPHGKPTQIINAIIDGKLILITSHAMIDEVRRVLFYPKIKNLLKKKKRATPENISKNFIDRLFKLANITSDEIKLDVIQDDHDDNIFLACAVEGKADFIISGDQHLTTLKNYKEIQILSPAEVINMIK